jgi:hypothetical protein
MLSEAPGRSARAQWLTRLTGIRFPTAALNTSLVYDSATSCPAGETFALALVVDDGCQWQNAVEK